MVYTIAAIPMLATLLFGNLELPLLLAVSSSVTVASISQEPLKLISLFLTSGILASIMAKGVRRRQHLSEQAIGCYPMKLSRRRLAGEESTFQARGLGI
jgi:hypothetical protein